MSLPLFYRRKVKGRYLASALLFSLFAIPIQAQKRIDCAGDGVHYEIDLSEIIIEYQATSFSATLSSLSIFGNRIGLEPKMVQKAEAATQQWNEFLKGLVVGSCLYGCFSKPQDVGVEVIASCPGHARGGCGRKA